MKQKMWKKLLAMALAVSLVTVGVTGCGGTQSSSDEGQTETADAASDYSDDGNWLKKPEITKDIDTFYIYPTAYNDDAEDAPDICDIDRDRGRAGRTAAGRAEGGFVRGIGLLF